LFYYFSCYSHQKPNKDGKQAIAERAEMHRLLDEEIDAEEKAQSASDAGNAKRA